MIKSKMLMVTPLDQNLDPIKMHYLNLYTVTSVCIFSILLPRHFLRFWQGEFVQQSRDFLVSVLLLYSQDFNVWVKGDLRGEIRC